MFMDDCFDFLLNQPELGTQINSTPLSVHGDSTSNRVHNEGFTFIIPNFNPEYEDPALNKFYPNNNQYLDQNKPTQENFILVDYPIESSSDSVKNSNNYYLSCELPISLTEQTSIADINNQNLDSQFLDLNYFNEEANNIVSRMDDYEKIEILNEVLAEEDYIDRTTINQQIIPDSVPFQVQSIDNEDSSRVFNISIDFESMLVELENSCNMKMNSGSVNDSESTDNSNNQSQPNQSSNLNNQDENSSSSSSSSDTSTTSSVHSQSTAARITSKKNDRNEKNENKPKVVVNGVEVVMTRGAINARKHRQRQQNKALEFQKTLEEAEAKNNNLREEIRNLENFNSKLSNYLRDIQKSRDRTF